MIATASRRAVRGFTLIELMVTVAILGLLASLLVPNVIGSQERAMTSKAEADLHSIAEAARMFYLDQHRMPTWSELVTPDAKGHPRIEDVRDPWDHPYVLAPGVSPSTLVVRSVGPDGVEGTDDDLLANAR